MLQKKAQDYFLFDVLGDNPKAKEKFQKLDLVVRKKIRNIWNNLYPIKLEANYSFEDLKKTLDLIVECMDKIDTNLEERLDYIKKIDEKIKTRKNSVYEQLKHQEENTKNPEKLIDFSLKKTESTKENLDKLFKRKDERIKHIFLMFFEYLRKIYKKEKKSIFHQQCKR